METLNENGTGTDGLPKKVDKTPAILAYVFFLGWIIAYVMVTDKGKNNKTEFNLFHLRQGIGVHLMMVVLSILSSFVSFIGFLSLIPIIFMVIGLIAANNGEMKPLPLLGEQFKEWFKGIV